MCEICRQNPCAPQCPNFEDEPLFYCNKCDEPIYADEVYYEVCGEIFCEDCVYEGKRVAQRDDYYCNNSGAPVISYGDKWED